MHIPLLDLIVQKSHFIGFCRIARLKGRIVLPNSGCNLVVPRYVFKVRKRVILQRMSDWASLLDTDLQVQAMQDRCLHLEERMACRCQKTIADPEHTQPKICAMHRYILLRF